MQPSTGQYRARLKGMRAVIVLFILLPFSRCRSMYLKLGVVRFAFFVGVGERVGEEEADEEGDDRGLGGGGDGEEVVGGRGNDEEVGGEVVTVRERSVCVYVCVMKTEHVHTASQRETCPPSTPSCPCPVERHLSPVYSQLPLPC